MTGHKTCTHLWTRTHAHTHERTNPQINLGEQHILQTSFENWYLHDSLCCEKIYRATFTNIAAPHTDMWGHEANSKSLSCICGWLARLGSEDAWNSEHDLTLDVWSCVYVCVCCPPPPQIWEPIQHWKVLGNAQHVYFILITAFCRAWKGAIFCLMDDKEGHTPQWCTAIRFY